MPPQEGGIKIEERIPVVRPDSDGCLDTAAGLTSCAIIADDGALTERGIENQSLAEPPGVKGFKAVGRNA